MDFTRMAHSARSTFRGREDRATVAIRSVVDGAGQDILPELSAECLRILQLEIVVHPAL